MFPLNYFDLIGRWYERVIRPRPDDPLLDLLAARPGDTVLDIGGGTGRITAALVDRAARVVVCDNAPGMLSETRGRGLAPALGSVTQLPFAANSADRVLVVDAFHHFVVGSPAVAQPLAARELLRVLKPGGLLVVEEPDTARFGVKLIVVMEALLLMGSRFLRADALAALFREAGGEIRLIQRGGFSYQVLITKAE